MHQVQTQNATTKKDYNLKIRTYSEKVLGYRVNLYGELHYIVNDLYLSEMTTILNHLTGIDAKYDDYGFVMLQHGYNLFVEKGFVYNSRLGRCVLSHDHDGGKVTDLAAYKTAKRVNQHKKGVTSYE